jgi:hypothetical protein
MPRRTSKEDRMDTWGRRGFAAAVITGGMIGLSGTGAVAAVPSAQWGGGPEPEPRTPQRPPAGPPATRYGAPEYQSEPRAAEYRLPEFAEQPLAAQPQAQPEQAPRRANPAYPAAPVAADYPTGGMARVPATAGAHGSDGFLAHNVAALADPPSTSYSGTPIGALGPAEASMGTGFTSYGTSAPEFGRMASRHARPEQHGERPAESYSERPAELYSERPAESYGERPAELYGERPAQSYGERPAQSYGERPAELYGERPAELYSERPAESYGERPAELYSERSAELYGERPAELYGERPAQSYGERPAQSYGERPVELYSERPAELYGERPAELYGERPAQSYGERPVELYGERPGELYADRSPGVEMHPAAMSPRSPVGSMAQPAVPMSPHEYQQAVGYPMGQQPMEPPAAPVHQQMGLPTSYSAERSVRAVELVGAAYPQGAHRGPEWHGEPGAPLDPDTSALGSLDSSAMFGSLSRPPR